MSVKNISKEVKKKYYQNSSINLYRDLIKKIVREGRSRDRINFNLGVKFEQFQKYINKRKKGKIISTISYVA